MGDESKVVQSIHAAQQLGMHLWQNNVYNIIKGRVSSMRSEGSVYDGLLNKYCSFNSREWIGGSITDN